MHGSGELGEWYVPPVERAYLRDLASRQAAIAALPVMERRRRQWLDLNDGVAGARPPVVIETWTFDRDFMPAGILRCASDTGRRIEWPLLRNIRNHELIDDDKVTPDTFDIDWFVEIDEFGVPVETRTVPDAQGVPTGYEFLHPFTDLERDLDRLRPARCAVDRDRTLRWKAFLEELLGGRLPVAIRTGTYGATMLTHRVIELMGMEAYFTAMYETPEALHRLMAFLRDNALRVMRWAEAEGLLRPNAGNQDAFGSSYNFTARLPGAAGNGGAARLSGMWGATNSQESVGVSPAAYREFCFPYYRAVAEPVGLLYYGCCEPPHPYWEDIRRYPHLKKVSINRWTDERFMGSALRGTGIVYSRKPDPNLLGVSPRLDEEAWSAHIRATLDATPGVPVEFIIRDVYTLHGDVDKARRAVALARAEIDRRG